jgi:hypothetical protein
MYLSRKASAQQIGEAKHVRRNRHEILQAILHIRATVVRPGNNYQFPGDMRITMQPSTCLPAQQPRAEVGAEPANVFLNEQGVYSVALAMGDSMYRLLHPWCSSASCTPDGSTPRANTSYEINDVRAWRTR